MKLLTSILLLSFVLMAQEPKPKPADASGAVKAAPTIPVELSAEYYAAAGTANALAQQAKDAQSVVDGLKTKMANICGPDYDWDLRVPSKPMCDPKPKPTAPAPKPEVKPEPAKPASPTK